MATINDKSSETIIPNSSNNENTERIGGVIPGTIVAEENLTTEQREAIDAAATRGITVKVFEPLKAFSNFKGFCAKDGTVYISTTANISTETAIHELTHYGEKNTEKYKEYRKAVLKTKMFKTWIMQKVNGAVDIESAIEKKCNDYIAAATELNERVGEEVIDTSFATAEHEVIAEFSESELFRESGIEALKNDNGIIEAEKRTIMDYIKAALRWITQRFSLSEHKKMLANKASELQRLERLYSQMLEDGEKQSVNNEFSFEGYAEDGKGRYRSNFPKHTPKKAKSQRILKYIQDVWSKKPIKLKIQDGNEIKIIEANFDPTYDEGGTHSDASKLMGGNRHGTSSEQRVTLDLADDYYQIATESKYNYSKDETGKDNPTHKDVIRWHYFINDIYFAEQNSNDYIPYTVTINVKEKTDGNYVYSFSAEKTEKFSTPRTLHAAVSSVKDNTTDAKLSINSIREKTENVKENSSKGSASVDFAASKGVSVEDAIESEDYVVPVEQNTEQDTEQNTEPTKETYTAEEFRKAIAEAEKRGEAKARGEERQKQKVKTETKKISERRRTLMDEIMRRSKWLADKLLSNSNTKHIPEGLKDVVAQFLLHIDYSSARKLKGGEDTKVDISFQWTLVKITKIKQMLFAGCLCLTLCIINCIIILVIYTYM